MCDFVTEQDLEKGYNTWIRRESSPSWNKGAFICSVCGYEEDQWIGIPRSICNCQKSTNLVLDDIRGIISDGFTCEKMGHNYWYITCSCGTVSARMFYCQKGSKCRGCSKRIFDKDKVNNKKKHVGSNRGIHTVLSYEEGVYSLACPSGTIKKSKNLSKYDNSIECYCEKCDPNRGWTHKKYSNTWKKIKDTYDLFWKTYYDFESWVDENLPRPDDKPCLNRIDSEEPYKPNNVWWASNDLEYHFSYWKGFLGDLPDGIELVGSSRKFTFKCGKGHVFTRDKGTTADTFIKGKPRKIKCLECQKEASIQRDVNKKPYQQLKRVYLRRFRPLYYYPITRIG